jgi:SAM-dependent methyltransferase
MLTRILHKLVSGPAVYDLVQKLAGAAAMRKRLAALAPDLPDCAFVIDLGAGTGLYRDIWSANCRYLCLDLDPLKLDGFRARHPADLAVLGDATRLPIGTALVDVVACTMMSHHLDDAALTRMLDEVARVLKPGGVFLFADPVWHPARLPGWLLWRYDRGAHPRRADTLRSLIAGRFHIDRWDDFALWHRYAACLARKVA